MDVANRLLWIGIALVMLAGGTAGLLVGIGAGSELSPHTPVLPPQMVETGWGSRLWVALLLVGVGLSMVLLGALVIRAELRSILSAGSQTFTLKAAEGADPRASPRIRHTALTRGLEEELVQVADVVSTKVMLVAGPRRRLSIQAAVPADTDLRRVCEDIGRELAAMEAAVGVSLPPAVVIIRLVTPRAA
ncbi:MAG: hypothetical protein ACRD2X_01820 [Vicinamibacteraceae bacterium]